MLVSKPYPNLYPCTLPNWGMICLTAYGPKSGNEYVDFFELINKVPPQQMTVSTGYSHQIISVMRQSIEKQISTIDQWTSAFLVFGAVYTQRFPEVAPGMFKYCEFVLDIAQTGPPFAWRQYEQFNSFRQSNPTNFPWDQHRWDFFFRCMYTRQVQVGMGQAPAIIPNKPTRHSQPMLLQACVLKVPTPHPASSCRQCNAPNPNKTLCITSTDWL